MPVIKWSEAFRLGDAATDISHVKLCTLLNAVADVSDAGFTGALDAFISHTEHHFAEENVWMDATDFPPRRCHRGEHDDALAFCHEVRKHAVAGEAEPGRRLAAELLAWLVQHVSATGRMMATYLAQMDNATHTMGHIG